MDWLKLLEKVYKFLFINILRWLIMNKIPTGVKIISIVYYITSVLGLLMGLLFFIGAGFIGVLLLISIIKHGKMWEGR